MSEVLSQDEIDQQLAAISKGEIEVEGHPPSDQRIIKIYDFEAQDAFSWGDL